MRWNQQHSRARDDVIFIAVKITSSCTLAILHCDGTSSSHLYKFSRNTLTFSVFISTRVHTCAHIYPHTTHARMHICMTKLNWVLPSCKRSMHYCFEMCKLLYKYFHKEFISKKLPWSWKTILLIHRNGSMLISSAEAGIFSSKAVNTSGCNTPSFPIIFPFEWISAHLPEKNVGSAYV